MSSRCHVPISSRALDSFITTLAQVESVDELIEIYPWPNLTNLLLELGFHLEEVTYRNGQIKYEAMLAGTPSFQGNQDQLYDWVWINADALIQRGRVLFPRAKSFLFSEEQKPAFRAHSFGLSHEYLERTGPADN